MIHCLPSTRPNGGCHWEKSMWFLCLYTLWNSSGKNYTHSRNLEKYLPNIARVLVQIPSTWDSIAKTSKSSWKYCFTWPRPSSAKTKIYTQKNDSDTSPVSELLLTQNALKRKLYDSPSNILDLGQSQPVKSI